MARKNITIILIIIVCVAFFLLFVRSCSPPSQRSVEELFVRNRASFDKIKSMIEEDKSIREVTTYGIADINSPLPHYPEKSEFSQQRYQEYLALLKKIGIKGVIHDENEIRFLVARWGFASSGWGVAIVNRETEPNNMIANLSDFQTGTSAVDAYCPIEKDWYIWMIWF